MQRHVRDCRTSFCRDVRGGMTCRNHAHLAMPRRQKLIQDKHCSIPTSAFHAAAADFVPRHQGLMPYSVLQRCSAAACSGLRHVMPRGTKSRRIPTERSSAIPYMPLQNRVFSGCFLSLLEDPVLRSAAGDPAAKLRETLFHKLPSDFVHRHSMPLHRTSYIDSMSLRSRPLQN
jgi:hypothetical protein